jgi:indole-3-glycerol phosphate synthase
MAATGRARPACKLCAEYALRSPRFAMKRDRPANRGAQSMAHVGATHSSVLDEKSADRKAEPTHDRCGQKTED